MSAEQDGMMRSELEDSPEWQRSVGKKLLGTHYREKDGSGHAVCLPGQDYCQIHYDDYNPHRQPVRHLIEDAPDVLLAAGVLGVSALIGPRATKKLARLLNRGFPLYAALDVLKLDQRYSQYISIGDSNFNIVQAREGVATLYEVENMKAKHYTLSYITYPTKKCLIGSMTIIFAESKHFLTSGSNIEFEMEKSQFESGSIRGELPVIKNKRIHWDL